MAFCTVCGAKQEIQTKVAQKENDPKDENQSLFMKYSGYLDNEALFKVAWAKEKGLIKSDAPNEAETIYQYLALRGHLESMYRYAMLLLAKEPQDTQNAKKWLKMAADQGHVSSRNYLQTMMGSDPEGVTYYRSDAASPSASGSEPTVQQSSSESGEILSGTQIYSQMSQSVVEIVATSDGKSISCASGIVVTSNGFVLTNAHAVLNGNGELYSKIYVKLNEKQYEAFPVAMGAPTNGKDDSIDIALLFVKDLKESKPAILGDSDLCENGQKVYLIGNSLGYGICITSGIISDRQRAMSGLSYPYIMTDAAANHGNSGGPLVDEHGNTVGVLVSGIESAEGMNFAIPINMVKSFLSYVFEQMHLSSNQCAELASLHCGNGNEKLSHKWERLLAGIKVVVEIIEFIACLL